MPDVIFVHYLKKMLYGRKLEVRAWSCALRIVF